MVERRKKKIPSIFKKSEKINMKMMKKEKTGFFDVAFPPPLSSCSSCCCSCCSCSCSASATSSSSSTSTTSFPSFHFFQSVFWNPPSLPSALDLFRPSNRPFPPCPRPPPSSPFNLICDERSCWCKSINCKTKRKVEQKKKKKKKKKKKEKKKKERKKEKTTEWIKRRKRRRIWKKMKNTVDKQPEDRNRKKPSPVL